jgi:hypothetical protein
MEPYIKQIDPGLFQDVSIFLETMTDEKYPRALWVDRFKFWWQDNPTATKDKAFGWILYDEHEIKGFYGYIQTVYYLNGNNVNAYSGTSWYVEEEYRSHSLDLFRHLFQQESACLLLNTTPSPHAEAIYNMFRFQILKQPWHNEVLMFPINGAELWDFLVRKKFSDNPLRPFLARLKYPVGWVIECLQNIRQFIFAKSEPNYQFKELTEFDVAYNDLWKSFKQRYDVMSVRDQKTLNWFYFGSPDLRTKRIVIEMKLNGKLIAYIAVNLPKAKSIGKEFQYFDVVDLVVIDERPSHYQAIFNELIRVAKDQTQKVILIRVVPFDIGIKKHLSKIGFTMSYKNPSFIYKYIGDEDEAIQNSLSNNHYATPLDGDRGYFVG